MSDVDVLESVLAKDEALLAGIRDDQWDGPTQCPDYDVRTLANHVAGWAQVFAASANERAADVDASTYTTDDPAGDFGTAAKDLIAGWRAGGTDREVTLMGGPQPAQMVLGMTLMEYVTHGLDLALATGQPVPFSDDELELTLERGQATLPDEYRGAGMPFGDKVDVPAGAPAVDRLLAFMGRQPTAG